jgi:hypothetical protein
MAETKTKRNAQRPTRRGYFRVCREPVVHLAGDARLSDASEKTPLPRVYDAPILFALARDKCTIFAGWNIDWPSVFQKDMPKDRQIYLRVTGSDGSEQKRVAVEPMLAMHYLTISGLHGPYRVEIGYYQPVDTWHSIASSDDVKMPLEGSSEIAEVDVATIPFHLNFQRLVNLFGASDDAPLAKVIAGFQNCLLNSRPNELSSASKQVLHEFNLSPLAVATERRNFEKTDAVKLARRRRALLRFAGTSASRGFEANAGS